MTTFITVLFSNNVNIVLDVLYNMSRGAPRASMNCQEYNSFPPSLPFSFNNILIIVVYKFGLVLR